MPRALSRPPVPDGPYLVAGIGRAGAAAARALARTARSGAGLRCWDAADSGGVRASRTRLEHIGARVSLRGEGMELLAGARCVVKSPGIAPDAPVLLAARAAGLPVIDELELGWRLSARPLVGITGTDGKTTTAALVAAALRAAGARPAPCGNSERHPPLSALPAGPGPAVCEVSSYQLEGCPALLADVAVLTNLTRDHLHRHGTLEAYGQAKRRLFVRGDRVAPLAVVGVGQAFGGELAADLEARGSRVLRVGERDGCDFRLLACRWDAWGSELQAQTPDGPIEARTSLLGRHNALNTLTALAVARLMGVASARAAEAIFTEPAPPGRLEGVDAGQPFEVLVDFAHTPEALRHAITTVRALTPSGRLLAVVSTAGVHDPGKRPEMGRVARELADTLVITGGALFGEPARSVLRGLASGAAQAGSDPPTLEPDRRAAIALALSEATAGDAVIITGRGALPRLRDGTDGEGERFDDRAVARELLAELGYVPGPAPGSRPEPPGPPATVGAGS